MTRGVYAWAHTNCAAMAHALHLLPFEPLAELATEDADQGLEHDN